MKIMLVLRGLPGAGKSSWVKENNLENYTISPDKIRLMYASPITCANGDMGINQKNDKLVWSVVNEMLETRLQNGDFTILDATNTTASTIRQYYKKCKTYGYRMYVVSFETPKEECLKRNKDRGVAKVPEFVIEKMNENLLEPIPKSINVISPDELNKAWFKTLDFSNYKAVNHIGDIHGCATVLKEYLKNFKDDEMYIFLGDYIDRGVENKEVLEIMMELQKKENVITLEGNHECHLRKWIENTPAWSSEFNENTAEQIKGIDKRGVKEFCRNLRACAYYKFDNKIVFCCHGGISNIPSENPTFISTTEMIKGTGNYQDGEMVMNSFYKAFENSSIYSFYQVHGHRNIKHVAIQENSACFNLEGSVEFGGNLRTLRLSHEDGFIGTEYKNFVFIKGEKTEITDDIDVADLVKCLRSNKYIAEKVFGNISSFNFTRDAFENNVWDTQTTKARGLFINTETNEIVNRGYDKFFLINQRPETQYGVLKETLSFPITVDVKEDGFLGLLGYDKEKDKMVFCSKSCVEGSLHADIFKEIFEKTVSASGKRKIEDYLRNNNKTIIFEVISPDKDPHIIEYLNSKIVMLDIVDRAVAFNRIPYDSLLRFGIIFGVPVKKRACTLNNWEEFDKWYKEVNAEDYKYNNLDIEGFVLTDANGFMLKQKTKYFEKWKAYRNISGAIFKYGKYNGNISNEDAERFISWLSDTISENQDKDIISLRKLYKA